MSTVASETPDPSRSYRQHIDDVVAGLGTNLQRGLTDSEAQSRLEQHGRNELAAEKPVPAWRRFLAQFQDVLVILLLVATAISAGLWAYERDAALPYEAIAIFAVVLLNATMGYVQESRAEAAVAALRAMSAADATVIRGGDRRSIPAILFVGVIMAAGTLFVLDASLPGGFVDGSGDLSYAQTMAFTTLMLFQVFNVVNARSDERSAFAHLFTNYWLWTAVAVSLLLQVVVIYVPFLQRAFGTVTLSGGDWLFCTAVASAVLWLREIGKLVARAVPSV